MKKYVLSAVSLVLVFACLILGGIVNNSLSAGNGFAKDYEVADITELPGLLQYVLQEEEKALGWESAHAADVLSAEGDDTSTVMTSSDAEELMEKYRGATITILTNQSSSLRSSYSPVTQGVVSATSYMNKEITMMIGENAILYQHKYYGRDALNKRDKQDDEESTVELCQYDLQVVDTGEKNVFVNIGNYTYQDNLEYRQIKLDVVDKWIEIPREMVDDFVRLGYQNCGIIQSFHDTLEYLIAAEDITAEDSFVTFNEYDVIDMDKKLEFNSFFLPDKNPEKTNITFFYDLTTASVPYISYVMSFNDEYTLEGQDWYTNAAKTTITTKDTSSAQLIIRNVNNTEVLFDENRVTLCVTDSKELDELFNIEKRGKKNG